MSCGRTQERALWITHNFEERLTLAGQDSTGRDGTGTGRAGTGTGRDGECAGWSRVLPGFVAGVPKNSPVAEEQPGLWKNSTVADCGRSAFRNKPVANAHTHTHTRTV